MAKEISGFIKLQIKGGQANPAPPVGPALGQRGVNIMEFCKAFNDKTKSMAGKPVPVEITVYKDKKFDFKIKSPPASYFIKEAVKLKGGSKEPGRNIVATISKKQFEFNQKRINRSGLNNKVNVMFLDYRELRSKYDKIASIEMIEAVGEKYLDKYFETIKKSLNVNGAAAIQGITIRDDLFERYRSSEDFIQKYIFPGGFLPSLGFMKSLTKKNNLGLLKVNSYSDDYAKTLAIWRENFLKAWTNIAPLGFDETFKRMWEFYLSYCEAGFKSKNIDLIQFSLQNK